MLARWPDGQMVVFGVERLPSQFISAKNEPCYFQFLASVGAEEQSHDHTVVLGVD